MALDRISTIERATLRADLQIRLNEVSSKDFLPAELNRWLNLGCFEVAIQLSAISPHWFMDREDLYDVAANTVYLTDDGTNTGTPYNIIRLEKVVWTGDAGDDVIIPIVDISELEGFSGNTILQPTANALPGVVCAHWGDALYFTGTWAAGVDLSKVTITFIKRPAKMNYDTEALALAAGASGEAYMDAPREHQDLVIMFAQKIAMFKKGLITGRAQLEEDITARLTQIRRSYLGQMAAKDVGKILTEGYPQSPLPTR